MSLFDFATEERATAVLSPCGRYRYRLERRWDDGDPLVWVMLNPSTADARDDDPTIRRVRAFTRREGYPAFEVVNVWPLRATSPKVLHSERVTIPGSVMEDNVKHIRQAATGRDVVVAWGANVLGPAHQRVVTAEDLRRTKAALSSASSVRCLGLTRSRMLSKHLGAVPQPRHPLMLRADTPLEDYRP